MTEFNKAIWKAKLKFDNLEQKATSWCVDSIYSLYLAMTLWPALDALLSGDTSLAVGVAASIGNKLIMDQLIALKKPKVKQASHMEKAIDEDPIFRIQET